MIFQYKGVNASGKKIKSNIEALNLEEAKKKLRSNGIIYTEIKADQNLEFFKLSFKRRYKIPPKELSNLSREIAMYIKSGISIVQALKITQNHYTQNKKLALFLKTLNDYLDEGENLYSALKKQNVAILPEFYVESIKISEDGGILDEVLLELSIFLKEQEKLKKEIKMAFAYPSFMVVVSFFMIAFMLTFVVPQITSVFASMHQELPTPTKVVIALGEFFQNNFLFLLIGLVVLFLFFGVFFQKSKKFRYVVDNITLKLPFFGEMAQKSELARFSYMAALLVRSGIPFVQTINLSANILNNVAIKKIFMQASKDVVEGKLLSSALSKSDIKLDFGFIQAVAIGEETSEIESVFSNISQLYFEENRDKTSMLLSLLEPVLMLLVGGSIGFIVAAMLLPIFSMSIQ